MHGIGTDIVAVARLAALLDKHGQRFLDRCFRPEEQALARGRGPREAATLAARWAAKEAFLKALRRSTDGIALHDIEVISTTDGAPGLRLHGTAAAALAAVGGGAVHLSLSHEDLFAVATVLIE